jgi:hypothetical protein
MVYYPDIIILNFFARDKTPKQASILIFSTIKKVEDCLLYEKPVHYACSTLPKR